MNDYKIKELMEEMELELISSMKRNLSRHLKEEDKVGFEFTQWQAEKLKELKKYQRENKDIIDGYTKGLDKKVSKHLKKELNQGAISSIKKHNKLFNTNIKASKLLNKSFFKTNDKKVNALIKIVNNDLKVANASALRMINDEYRQVIHKSTFFLANGTVSPQKAVDMATKDFLSRGLNCIEYKDGRRVNIASYSEMAVRTASLRTQLMGDGNFRKSIGRHLVIALASNAACPLCSKWENKIMIDDVYSGGTKKDGDYPLLSYAMKNGFLHPNCRDGIATYYPELEDIDKSYENGKDGSESDVTNQEDLNYINQRIRQFERLSLGSIDKENIRYYENKKREWEKQKSVRKIVNETRNMISPTFAERTKGVKIVPISEKHSYIDLVTNKVFLGYNADEYSLIHELAHKLQQSFTKEEKNMYNEIIKSKFSKYKKNDFKKVKTKTGKYWLLKDSSKFVSEYQTRIYGNGFGLHGDIKLKYAQEYFSEGVKYFYKNTELLRSKDNTLYKFIKKVVDNK